MTGLSRRAKTIKFLLPIMSQIRTRVGSISGDMPLIAEKLMNSGCPRGSCVLCTTQKKDVMVALSAIAPFGCELTRCESD
jgi:hypothetical protein